MTETLTINFGKAIPIFPLPNCVLLPHTTIPLHIFEPRYRVMTRDALDSRGLIAMALFEGTAWKDDYQGRPPLRPMVCVGYIARHQQLSDGRYQLLLQGLCRARIVEEVDHEPYRMALLRPTEPADTMEIDLSEDRERIVELLDDPVLKELACVSSIHRWISSELPTPVLIDLSITALCEDVEERYRMLGESEVSQRVRWLEDLLRTTRKTLDIARHFTPESRDDGMTLN